MCGGRERNDGEGEAGRGRSVKNVSVTSSPQQAQVIAPFRRVMTSNKRKKTEKNEKDK